MFLCSDVFLSSAKFAQRLTKISQKMTHSCKVTLCVTPVEVQSLSVNKCLTRSHGNVLRTSPLQRSVNAAQVRASERRRDPHRPRCRHQLSLPRNAKEALARRSDATRIAEARWARTGETLCVVSRAIARASRRVDKFSAFQFFHHGRWRNVGFGHDTPTLWKRKPTHRKLCNESYCDVTYRNLTNSLCIQTIVVLYMPI